MDCRLVLTASNHHAPEGRRFRLGASVAKIAIIASTLRALLEHYIDSARNDPRLLQAMAAAQSFLQIVKSTRLHNAREVHQALLRFVLSQLRKGSYDKREEWMAECRLVFSHRCIDFAACFHSRRSHRSRSAAFCKRARC